METIRTVCAHDCPDMCSLLAEVENGRVLRVRGDPEQPFTAGFACAKVNRDADLVHSPERIRTPLRRTGAKGEGKFAPIGGADPEAVDQSDLIVAWGADLVATNVHFWAKAEAARRRGVKIVVIDPRKSRTARQADRHLQIRIGTDAALALGVMYILARDGLVDCDYVAAHTVGFDRLATQGLPPVTPPRP